MRRILAVLTIVGVVLSGCEGHLASPEPLNVVADPVYARENDRLTERSELLSRVEPFVGLNDQAGQKLNVTIALPGEGDLLKTPRPSSEAPHHEPVTGGQYWISVSTGTTALDKTLFDRLLLDYRDDRVLQIDRACTAYFTRLDEISGNVDFGTSMINIGGDYVTVLMGLAGSPAKHLAVLAGGQAAFNQSVDATRSLLLLNPAPAAVRALVNASQRRLLTDNKVSTTPTYAGVESQIQAYALACTPIGIRAIVNEAVTQRAQVEDPDRTGPIGQALLVELTTMLNAGQAEAQKISQIDEQAAAYLLWVTSTPDCTSNTCEAYKRTAERYPALISAYGRLTGTKPIFTTRLNDLAAAEPGIGSRRDLLQANLVSETKEAEHAKALADAQAAARTAQNRATTAEQVAQAKDEVIAQLRQDLQAARTSPTSGSVADPVNPNEGQ